MLREQPLTAKRPKNRVTDRGNRLTEMIREIVASRRPLYPRGAGVARLLISTQTRRRIDRRATKLSGQHGGILDRHGGTLRQEWQHGMCGVPHQTDEAVSPTPRWSAIAEHPFLPVARRLDKDCRLSWPFA